MTAYLRPHAARSTGPQDSSETPLWTARAQATWLESPSTRRRVPSKITWLVLLSALLHPLFGCQRRDTTTAGPPPPVPTEDAGPHFRWLEAHEREAAEELVASGRTASHEVEQFLGLYDAACRELPVAEANERATVLFRLWEFGRAARLAGLSARQVLDAVRERQSGLETRPAGWQGHYGGDGAARSLVSPPASGSVPSGDCVIRPLEELDEEVISLLRLARPSKGRSFWESMAESVRHVVLLSDAGGLDPELPMTFMGTAEPLSRTVFLAPRDAVTDEPWPAWLLASVLVHEAEHIRWYREVAGDDPLLLRPLPDERNAFRQMHLFLRRLRQVTPTSAAEAAKIEAEARKLGQLLHKANGLLGYPAGDFGERTDILVDEEALLTDPSAFYEALSLAPE